MSAGRSAPLRLGIAGCGRIVERGYLPALRGVPALELAGLADPQLGRARRLCAGTEAVAFAAVEEMIATAGLDALVVATPAESHLAVARLAAEAGLPALVEKPPARSVADALALACLDPAPAIGFNRRFLQGAELRPLLPPAGWLELNLELRFRSDAWGAHASRDDALLDAGTHLIDLAAFLSGSDPIAVRGATVEPSRAAFELELGRGRARIRCATDRPYAERVELRDRSGQTIGAARTDRLRSRLDRIRGGEEPLVGSLHRQLERFATAARGGDRGSLADADAGARALEVVEAARRSAQMGGAEITVSPRDGLLARRDAA